MMTQNAPQPICQSPRPQIFCKFLLDALIFFKFMSGCSQLAVKSTINEQTTVKFPTTCHTTYSNYLKSSYLLKGPILLRQGWLNLYIATKISIQQASVLVLPSIVQCLWQLIRISGGAVLQEGRAFQFLHKASNGTASRGWVYISTTKISKPVYFHSFSISATQN